MSDNIFTIGLVQTECGEQSKDNLYNQMGLIRKAAAQGAQVICLQELFHTPYFCTDYDESNFEWAEPANGEIRSSLSELASELKVVIIAPFFEKRAKGIYHNSLMVIDADGSLLGLYRKMHIPDDPGFYEKYYFTPGDEESGYRVFDTAYGRIGTLICWDQWFPEAARITAMKGADIIFYPTAIGTLAKESSAEKKKFHEAWETIQRSHAIANGCYVASVNRTGKEKGTKFWGGSFVSGPFGEILAKAGDSEEILIAEVDPDHIEEQRRTWPFFRDRRTDTYRILLRRFADDGGNIADE